MNNSDNDNTTEADEQLIEFYENTIIDCLKQIEGVKRKLLSLVKKK